jgi:VWFA-related protein
MRLPWIAVLSLIGVSLFGQTKTTDDSQPTTVLRSNPRLVIVNVVASDASGKPAHGLTPQDFTILEDGKPQSIRAFDERGSSTATQAAREDAPELPPLNLGPNVYTNYVRVPKDPVTNVLLFDVLNMRREDLSYAKMELMRTLKKLPEGERFALFVMGAHLHMIQGFTWDKQVMLDAASSINTHGSIAYSDARSFSSEIAEGRATMATPSTAANPRFGAVAAAALGNLATTLAEEQDDKLDARTLFTTDLFYVLARALVAIPGRKNVIWITSGFVFDQKHDDFERLRHLSSQLAASQIAVYPIDARGVIIDQPDASTNDAEFMYGTEGPNGFQYNTNLNSYNGAGSWINKMNNETIATREAMTNLAEQTGGRAFFNQNTFLPAVSRIIESGSDYYAIAYRPTNDNWNGNFRKIHIKTSRPGVKLLYRTGYYAVPDPLQLPKSADRDRALQFAMEPSAPPSTTLIIKTRVVPPPDSTKPAILDFLADVADLATPVERSARSKKEIDVIFVASAFDRNDKVTDSQSWTVKMDLTDSELQELRKRGLQIHAPFTLRSGTYRLRMGILDRNSGKLGTLDVPLTIAQAEVAPQPAAH